MNSHQKIIRSAGTISLLTLVSRITGYFRDNLLAQILGAAHSSDAFIVAFRIPNLLRRLVGEGALTAALVPTLSDYRQADRRKELWEFVSQLFTALAAVVLVLALLGILLSPLLVNTLAYGFVGMEEKWELTVSLNRLMFPYIIFISLAAMVMATLNTLGVFGLPASTPIFLNLSIIGAAWFLSRHMEEPAYGFAIGVLIGGLLQLLIQIPLLVKRGWRPSLRLSFSHPGVRQVGKLMLPGVLGLGVTQLMLIIDSQFASFLGKGAVSALYYAGRVNELTLGVFAIAVSTVILPALSRHASAGETEELKATLMYGLRIVSFVTLPSAVGLIIFRREIVSLLFQRGAFDSMATAMTSEALLFYATGLFALGGIRILAPAFYARKDTRTPVYIAASILGFHVLLCTVLSRTYGLSGIALADSISATLNMCLLIYFLRRSLKLSIVQSFVVPSIIFGVAAAAMGFIGRPVLGWMHSLLGGMPAENAFALLFSIILLGAFYGTACRLAGRPEPGHLLSTLFRRRSAATEGADD